MTDAMQVDKVTGLITNPQVDCTELKELKCPLRASADSKF